MSPEYWLSKCSLCWWILITSLLPWMASCTAEIPTERNHPDYNEFWLISFPIFSQKRISMLLFIQWPSERHHHCTLATSPSHFTMERGVEFLQKGLCPVQTRYYLEMSKQNSFRGLIPLDRCIYMRIRKTIISSVFSCRQWSHEADQ